MRCRLPANPAAWLRETPEEPKYPLLRYLQQLTLGLIWLYGYSKGCCRTDVLEAPSSRDKNSSPPSVMSLLTATPSGMLWVINRCRKYLTYAGQARGTCVEQSRWRRLNLTRPTGCRCHVRQGPGRKTASPTTTVHLYAREYRPNRGGPAQLGPYEAAPHLSAFLAYKSSQVAIMTPCRVRPGS